MAAKGLFRVLAYFIVIAACSSESLDYLFNDCPELEDYITAEVNKNVNVTCLITATSDYTSVQTQWQLLDTMEFLSFSQNKMAINHSYISVQGDYNEVLIISNFTEDLDRLRVGCRGNISSDELGTITFGLPGQVL